MRQYYDRTDDPFNAPTINYHFVSSYFKLYEIMIATITA